MIVCANRDGGFEELDDDLLLALGDHAGAALQSERLAHDLRETPPCGDADARRTSWTRATRCCAARRESRLC